jgi:phospholipid transport system substrate-binding protein
MRTDLTRRTFLIVALSGTALAALPRPAAALDISTARSLIDSLVVEVNRIINSGETEQQMFVDFEKVFVKYSDVPIIARSALGVAARAASAPQMAAFTQAFQGYISRKYGRRFREFIGGQITVVDAHPLNENFEVVSVAKLQGQAPFDLRWWVSSKSGRDLFYNIIIEGVNMLATERTEVGAMLDQQHGDINALIAQLKVSG